MDYHSNSPNKQIWISDLLIDQALRNIVEKLDKEGIRYNIFQDEVFIDPQSHEEMMVAAEILQGELGEG